MRSWWIHWGASSKAPKEDGFWVRGADLKNHEYAVSQADDFVIGDLRDPYFCKYVIDRRFDEVYQLAADMGGAGFVFVGENDADIMHNSGLNKSESLRCVLQEVNPKDILLFFRMHVSGLQPNRSGLAKL